MDKIAGVPVAEFLKVAEEVAKRYMALPDNPDKSTGGYIGIISRFANNSLQLFCQLGDPEYSELERTSLGSILSRTIESRAISRRIFAIPLQPGECHSSVCVMEMTSESEGLEIGRTIIGVVAGFNRDGNEAIAMAIWLIFRWLMWGEVKEMAKPSHNPMFDGLWGACHDLVDRPDYSE